MKLLITDDQNSVHMYFDRMIPYGKLGIRQVFHAKNGEEALGIIRKEWPDILILDIRMPKMDGLKLLQALEGERWEHRVMILSAYNEFDYARQCMAYGVKDYLLKPIDNKEVEERLQKMVKELTDWKSRSVAGILSRLLQEGKWNLESQEILQTIRVSGYGIVCAKTGDSLSFAPESQVQKLAETASDEITLWCFETDSRESWDQFFQAQKEKNGEVTVGFGRFHEKKEEFPEAVMEGMEALNQGFYQTGTYLYQKDAMHFYKDKEEEGLSKRLSQSFQNGNVEEMKKEVEKLFFIFKRENIHPRYVQDFCTGVLIGLNPNFMETLEKLKGSPFGNGYSFADASGMKNVFLRLLINMRCQIAPEEVQTDADVVERIRHYIDTNYEKDLSLTTLSKHFFISKYQISRLFKKQFGINYSDYILKARMEAAAVILLNFRGKLDEAARRTGFEETSYFSKVFSKYYGVSPGEYRKKQKEKKDGEDTLLQRNEGTGGD